MNKPSERIVVFVTPAQKRAIAASAEKLGISVSELMRRAVLSFGATSEQVKAASIVDRLRAPRAPDALNAALQRAARGTRHTRAALPPVLQTGAAAEASPAQTPALSSPSGPDVAPLLPAGVLAALAAAADLDAAAHAEADADAVAPHTTDLDGGGPTAADSLVTPRVATRRTRIDVDPDEDDPHGDPTTEGGRFA